MNTEIKEWIKTSRPTNKQSFIQVLLQQKIEVVKYISSKCTWNYDLTPEFDLRSPQTIRNGLIQVLWPLHIFYNMPAFWTLHIHTKKNYHSIMACSKIRSLYTLADNNLWLSIRNFKTNWSLNFIHPSRTFCCIFQVNFQPCNQVGLSGYTLSFSIVAKLNVYSATILWNLHILEMAYAYFLPLINKNKHF